MSVKLNSKNALIFRIVHLTNVPWILDHGLHCKTSSVCDPDFVPIGNAELIQKRSTHTVPIGPRGSLADYIPFYFTPWSVMMYNIKTGYNGSIKCPNPEIAILVSSLHKLKEIGTRFVFTNGHAYMKESEYFEDMAHLDKVDWPLLRNRNFKRDPEDPGKLGRYQAEAPAHQHVPVDVLLGITCYDSNIKEKLKTEVRQRSLSMDVVALQGWYF